MMNRFGIVRICAIGMAASACVSPNPATEIGTDDMPTQASTMEASDPREVVQNGVIRLQLPQAAFDSAPPRYEAIPAAGYEGMPESDLRRVHHEIVVRSGMSSARDSVITHAPNAEAVPAP
jgi:hypothetical protein